MSSHTLTTILPMSAEDFYNITETEAFDQFQIAYLGLESHILKEEIDEETHIFRRVNIKPKTSIPKILLKFASNEELSYEDTQYKSKISKEIRFKTKAPVMTDHIHVEGIINIEPLDDQRCLRVLKVTFRFTGPLQWFSSMIEGNILSELKKTIDLLPTIVADYKKHIASKKSQESGSSQTSSNLVQNNSSGSENYNNGITSILNSNKEPVAQLV